MKFLMFAASLRQDSCNKKLINLAAQLMHAQKNKVDLANFSEFDAPLYNADVQNNQGFPAGIKHFVERMQKADALVISSPEYNFSMPGTLKNLIDWVSRISPMPWSKYPILLMSASPALVGGNRGLWSTRIPLECCGAHVHPDMFSLASAYDAFADDGQLKNTPLQTRLQENMEAFSCYVNALSSINS